MATNHDLNVAIVGIRLAILAIAISLVLPVLQIASDWAKGNPFYWFDGLIVIVLLGLGIFLILEAVRLKVPKQK